MRLLLTATCSASKGVEIVIKKSKRIQGKARDEYLQLVSKFPLISLRTQEDLDAAQAVMDKLLAQGDLSPGEMLYLDALSDLVATYEEEHFPFKSVSDAEMLRHLMEAKEISQVELHRSTGVAKSTVSEILAGKKGFSRQNIAKFAEFFGVDKGVLAENF